MLGILAGPTDLLLLNFFITDSTLSLFVGAIYIKMGIMFGLARYLFYFVLVLLFFFCEVFVEFISEENLDRYNISFFLL